MNHHMTNQSTDRGNNHDHNPKLQLEQKFQQQRRKRQYESTHQNHRECQPTSPIKISKATTTTTPNSSYSWSSSLYILTSKLNLRILLQVFIAIQCILSLNLMININDDSHSSPESMGSHVNNSNDSNTKRRLAVSSSLSEFYDNSSKKIRIDNRSNINLVEVSSSSTALYDTIDKTIEKNNHRSNNQGMDLSSSIEKEKMIHTSFCVSKDTDEVEDEKNKHLFTIDNYCSRPHYDYDPMIHTDTEKESTTTVTDSKSDIKTNNNKKKIYRNDKPPILIIGGTDGSGTRAFVNLLKNELNVPMVIDDDSTLDIHANVLFEGQGWPALANYIFNFTHSGNYNIDTDIPKYTKDIIMDELQRFKKYYDDTSTNQAYMYHTIRQMKKESFERSSYAPPMERAAGVSYGFKAPIAMMLLPFFLELYGNVKFIHVIRDGRDVSFSSNMSPVTKFYDQFYGIDSAKQRRIKAMNLTESLQKGENRMLNSKIRDSTSSILSMDLWNDWNIQVSQFCQKASADSIKMMMGENDQHEEVLSEQKKSFDYITVRAEDLVNPSATTKYALITKLASFVGTIQYPIENLCSYIQNVKLQDMGQTLQYVDRNDPNIHNQTSVLQHRYGKWMKILQNETTLSETLHERVAVALKHFGYEPYQNDIDYDLYHSSASRICP